MENFLEEYWLSMRQAVSSSETPTQSAKLQEEAHDKQVSTAKETLGEADANSLLSSHLLNFVEHEQEKEWQTTNPERTESSSYICLYITYFWLFMMTRESKSKVTFHPTPEEPRFDAQVGRSKKTGELVSGHNYDRLPQAEKVQVESYELLLDHIKNAAVKNSQISRDITLDLIKSIRKFASGEKCALKTHQIIMVVPSELGLEERSFLRDCCTTSGFTRISMLTDSSLVTYRLFSTLPAFYKVTMLVVSISGSYQITMEIFGCDKNGAEINAVKQLAVVSQEWSLNKQIFAGMYKSALAQLTRKRQKSIWYYTVLSEYPNLADICLEQFLRFGEHLRKIHVVRDHKLMKTVSDHLSGPGKLQRFFDVMATDPLSPAPVIQQENDNVDESIEDDKKDIVSKKGSFVATKSLPFGKLPLNIDTQDGKLYCVTANCSWTVRSLKECFKDVLGQHNHGPFLLQYETQRLYNENSLLNEYNIEPDSIIKAHFYKMIKKPAMSTESTESTESKENEEPEPIGFSRKNIIQLLGYCVARKYGMEQENAEGINRGTLIVARNASNTKDDSEDTVGEFRRACRINGLKGVYWKVNFNKQLHLRSTGIRIEHVSSTGGNCVKCNKNDKVEMCVPRNLIGDSNRDLFYIR